MLQFLERDQEGVQFLLKRRRDIAKTPVRTFNTEDIPGAYLTQEKRKALLEQKRRWGHGLPNGGGKPGQHQPQDEDGKQLSVLEQMQEILNQNSTRVLDLFRKMDEDDDGTVSKKEFRESFKMMGYNVPTHPSPARPYPPPHPCLSCCPRPRPCPHHPRPGPGSCPCLRPLPGLVPVSVSVSIPASVPIPVPIPISATSIPLLPRPFPIPSSRKRSSTLSLTPLTRTEVARSSTASSTRFHRSLTTDPRPLTADCLHWLLATGH